MNLPKTALILCGGKGTRLNPITHEIPKAMLPIQGRPLLEHILDLFKRHDVTEILLSVGHLKEKIKDHFEKNPYPGLNIEFVEETEPLGTAGPLKLVENRIDSAFFVCNGDTLFDINLEEMYNRHKQNSALVTIALTTVNDPGTRGVARLEGDTILEFIEKPGMSMGVALSPSNLINTGMYLVESAIFQSIPEGRSMLEKDVFPKVAEGKQLYGFQPVKQFFDIGTPERYDVAIKQWKSVK